MERMKRLRPGLVDICAAVLVLFVLFMPERDVYVSTDYRFVEAGQTDAVIADIARAQAQFVAHPDGRSVDALAQLLATPAVRQHDQALRLAGDTADKTATDSRWRALSAIAVVHGDRIEIQEALAFGEKALAACDEPGADCPDYERLRLDLYVEQLRAGMRAIARGADPRADPDGFRREMGRIHPTATFRVRPGGQ